MEENFTPNTENNQPAPVASNPWTKRIIAGALAVAAVGAVGIGLATANGGPGWHGGPRMGFSGHHGMGFAEHRLERMLEGIDATDEQETKIKAIIEATEDKVFPMADEFRDTREEVAKLLGASTIDRAAAETLRAQRIAKVDEASKALTTALLDIAEVLTPEQRAELLEHLKERRGRW
jgi:Spy/CpxP family protein refolding chaperone